MMKRKTLTAVTLIAAFMFSDYFVNNDYHTESDVVSSKNLFQRDIANFLKIDKSTYRYYEKEVHDISTDILCKVPCLSARTWHLTAQYAACDRTDYKFFFRPHICSNILNQISEDIFQAFSAFGSANRKYPPHGTLCSNP